MGAWGVLAFDNDDALDWVNRLVKVSDLSLVDSAFTNVDEADYLEAPSACEALAACELVARLMGRPGYRTGYTEKVDAWVTRHPQKPSPALLSRAASVIDRIMGEDSELNGLWDENEQWLEAVADLRRRVCG